MFFRALKKWIFIAVALCLPQLSMAEGVFEFSVGFTFQRSKFDDGSYTRTRGYRTGLGWHFTEVSEMEVFYQNAETRTVVKSVEDTTYQDQFFGFNWVQSLLPRTVPVQPYFKAGLGQLNRRISSIPDPARTVVAEIDSVTGNAAVGARIFLSQRVAFKIELSTIIIGGKVASADENITFSVGGSFFF